MPALGRPRRSASDQINPIGRIQPDRVFRLIGNKRCRGVGRPFPCPVLSATPYRRLSAPALPAPVQQGPVGDARQAFIGAPPGCPALVRERDASEGA